MNIRHARPADIDEIVALGRLMHFESPRFAPLPYCEHKAAQTCRALIASNMAALLVATDEDDAIVGMVAGMVVEHFFSTALYSCDFVVYVRPEFRNGSTAMRMVRRFEQFARTRGATEFQLGISTDVTPERTCKLYEHLGYARSGYVMVKQNV